MLKRLSKSLIIILAGILIGTILNIAAFSLPTNRIKNNVKESLEIFEEEGTYHEVIKGYIGSRLDNYTDSIIIANVLSGEGNGIIDKAMNVYRVNYEDQSPTESLVSYMNNEEGFTTFAYARYWHGYLVVLKPLFMFFNYGQIRLLNMALQLAILCILVCLLTKRNMKRYIIPLFLSFFYLCPVAVFLSLQFSTIFYDFSLFMTIILLKHEYIYEKKLYYLLFLIIGMCTSYFDFLTYPLATLGLPLTLYYVLESENNFKNKVFDFIRNCLYWGLGYIGMWAGKWLVASILTGNNIFLDAYNTILTRTSTETSAEEVSRIEMLLKNLNVLFLNKMFISTIIIFCIVCCFYIFKKKRTIKSIVFLAFPFVIIMMMPIVWYILTCNHSFIHFWYVYRTLVILVFSLLCMFIKISDNKKDNSWMEK